MKVSVYDVVTMLTLISTHHEEYADENLNHWICMKWNHELVKQLILIITATDAEHIYITWSCSSRGPNATGVHTVINAGGSDAIAWASFGP